MIVHLILPVKKISGFITIPRIMFACVWILIFLLYSVANAQSKNEKKAMVAADELYQDKKYEEAIDIYQQAVAYLSVSQQYQLGISYFAGAKEKPENYKEALKWLNKAAEGGFQEAMNALSYCYGQGLGVEKNQQQELNWLKKSADLGNASAMCTMGYRYEKGLGVSIDKMLAVEMYKKAADKGNKEAANNLGLIRFNEKNGLEAIYWLKKAANADMLTSMLMLGQIYEEGIGVERDLDEAVLWYTKISKSEGYTTAHRKAITRIQEIEVIEPPANISLVKPLMLKIISGAGNQFAGIIGRETQPIGRTGIDFLSKSYYYTCMIDLGFKNAIIKKEVVEDKTIGDYRTRAGTFYSYSADIVRSIAEEDADRIFDQWVKLLKAVVPGWEWSNGKDNGRTFYIGGKLTNGKTINIKLGICCPANNFKQVYIYIDSK